MPPGVLLTGALIGGVVVALRPALLPLVLLAAVGIALAGRWARVEVGAAAVLALLVFQGVAALRYSWLEDQLSLFVPLRYVTGIGLALALLLLGGRRLLEPRFRLPTLLILAYVAWLIAGGQWSGDPLRATRYSGWLLLLATCSILTILLNGAPERFWRRWLLGLCHASLLLGLGNLLVIGLGLEQTRRNRWVGGEYITGFRGLMAHPNVMGDLAAVGVAALLAARVLRRDSLPRWYWASSLLLLSGLAAASLCRAALIGVVLALLAYAVARGIQARVSPALGIGALIAALALALATPTGQGIVGRFVKTDVQLHSGEAERARVWTSYLRAFTAEPMLGTGFQVDSAASDYLLMRRLPHSKAAHNVLISYGLSTGVPGLLLFLAMIGVALVRVLRWRDRSLALSFAPLLAGLLPQWSLHTIAAPGAAAPLVFWVPLIFAMTLSPPRVAELSPEP